MVQQNRRVSKSAKILWKMPIHNSLRCPSRPHNDSDCTTISIKGLSEDQMFARRKRSKAYCNYVCLPETAGLDSALVPHFPGLYSKGCSGHHARANWATRLAESHASRCRATPLALEADRRPEVTAPGPLSRPFPLISHPSFHQPFITVVWYLILPKQSINSHSHLIQTILLQLSNTCIPIAL